MKVRQELIDQGKSVARPNKELGARPSGRYCFGRVASSDRFLRRVLECPHYRRANCQNRSLLAAGGCNRRRCLWGNFVSFAVHHVILEIFRANGLKRSQANFQRNFGDFDSFLAQLFQDLRREVQACCRSCYGHRLLCKYRLIELSIRSVVGAPDIGRQGHVPNSADDIGYRALRSSVVSKSVKPLVTTLDNFGYEIGPLAKESLPSTDFSPRTNQGFP